MLSQIDYYTPSEMSLEESYSRQADYLETEMYDGSWEAMTATYTTNLKQADHSPEWWAGFIQTLAQANGVNLARLAQPSFKVYLNADEF